MSTIKKSEFLAEEVRVRRKTTLNSWLIERDNGSPQKSPSSSSSSYSPPSTPSSEDLFNPHSWEHHTINKPIVCQYCDKFIWGIAKQGYKCSVCKYVAHTKCVKILRDEKDSCRPKTEKSEPEEPSESRFSGEYTPPVIMSPSKLSVSQGEEPKRQRRHSQILSKGKLKVLLVSETDEVAVALADEFKHPYREVKILRGDIFEHRFDCVVGNGSSFGLLTGSRIIKFFGEGIKDKITEHILTNYRGEQNIGTSFIVETGHKKYKYICHTALRHTRSSAHVDPYFGFRSTLLEIERFNREKADKGEHDKQIRSVAFHFSVFTYRDYDVEELARKIFLSYHLFVNPLNQISDETTLLDYEELLKPPPKATEEDKERDFLEFLTDGTIAHRGFVNSWQFDYLLFLIENDEHPHMQRAAAQVVAQVIAGALSDKGKKQSTRKRANKVISQLVQFATQGLIEVHNTIEPADITEEQLIGEGGEAKVYKGLYKGRQVAVKKFHESALEFKPADIRKEVALLSLLEHNNLVEFIGAKVTTSALYVVTALMETDMCTYLKQQKDPLPWALLLRFALDAAYGMEYLHSLKVIHRDLKSKNLLVDKQLNVLVCDYGVSRVIEDIKKTMTGGMGTVSWMAPEVLNHSHYTEKADVYSFGVILWELYTREEPFKDLTPFSIPIMVTKGERPKIPKTCPSMYKKVIKSCWHQNPKNRPDFSTIIVELRKMLSHPELMSQRRNTVSEKSISAATLKKGFL